MNSRYMKIEYCRIPGLYHLGDPLRDSIQATYAIHLGILIGELEWEWSGILGDCLEEHLLVSSHY